MTSYLIIAHRTLAISRSCRLMVHRSKPPGGHHFIAFTRSTAVPAERIVLTRRRFLIRIESLTVVFGDLPYARLHTPTSKGRVPAHRVPRCPRRAAGTFG